MAVVTGLIITVFVAQRDPWTQQKMGQFFKKTFEKAFDCTISFKVQDLNFFEPHFIITDVSAWSCDGSDWSWSCKTFKINFSWLHFITSGAVDLRVTADGLEAHSGLTHGSLAIMPHVAKLMQKPDLPVPAFLKGLTCKNATLYVQDETTKGNAYVSWNSSSLKIGEVFKTSMALIDGVGCVHNRTCIQSLAGTIHINAINTKQGPKISLRIATNFRSPYLANDICYVTGIWETSHGRFSLYSIKNDFVCDPIIITQGDSKISARFPVGVIWRLMHNDHTDNRLSGHGTIKLHATRGNKPRIDGQFIAEDVLFDGKKLIDTFKISFAKRDVTWQGGLGVRSHQAELSGSWRLNERTGKGAVHLENSTAIPIPRFAYWHILPEGFSCHLDRDTTGRLTGAYQCTATNILSAVENSTKGTVTVADNQFKASGTIKSNHYAIEGGISPRIAIYRCFYNDADGTPLIQLKSDYDATNQTRFKGYIAFPFIRSLLQQIMQYDLQGEGTLAIKGITMGDTIDIDMMLTDATIRLPQTYNFIDSFKAHLVVDLIARSLTLRDMRCSLHTGALYVNSAKAFFDADGQCIFAHVPVLFDHCLLNIKKDLFAIISGNLLLTKEQSADPCVKGRLIIDRAQLKENLFAERFQKRLFSYTGDVFDVPGTHMQCDISLETKSPIRVDTAFLKTNVKVNIHARGDIRSPDVSGSITLLSGTLEFPYKPLHIVKGTIYFLPKQLYDPMVELVARNTIKNHIITLHVTDSLRNHHIILDASPPLTEEQIISLLLFGSEEESLNMMMPALIVQNVKGLIFGSDQSSILNKYFKPLLKPFNISLVPSFTDQSGRGGLRGALEIDINDRWHAMIQKNFSLSEDTRVELEYLLSDDISLRGIRDERRDLGGEVEVRWKF